jgi:hypothetical protein
MLFAKPDRNSEVSWRSARARFPMQNANEVTSSTPYAKVNSQR